MTLSKYAQGLVRNNNIRFSSFSLKPDLITSLFLAVAYYSWDDIYLVINDFNDLSECIRISVITNLKVKAF